LFPIFTIGFELVVKPLFAIHHLISKITPDILEGQQKSRKDNQGKTNQGKTNHGKSNHGITGTSIHVKKNHVDGRMIIW
jgi:hypothetical protein